MCAPCSKRSTLPSSTLHTLNDRVMQIAQGEKYITFFAAVFDPAKRMLEYVNCGHKPPLFVYPSGRDTLLEEAAASVWACSETFLR